MQILFLSAYKSRKEGYGGEQEAGPLVTLMEFAVHAAVVGGQAALQEAWSG